MIAALLAGSCAASHIFEKVTDLTKRISEEIEKLYREWRRPERKQSLQGRFRCAAAKLGRELNRCGYSLDIDLIRGASSSFTDARTRSAMI